MKILVVGLGLIGGSICKGLKKYTSHTVIGSDISPDTENAATVDGAVDGIFNGDFEGFDLAIIALFPDIAESYLKENIQKMNKNTLITDVCGIKGKFSENMKNIAKENGLRYIGMHPMAGKEIGGYFNSSPDLFKGANFIITPDEDSNQSDIELLKAFAEEIGFGKIVITSSENHDKMIAYTSQLAHIVSSAYVKSPQLQLECGFSGGSFQDMTRVATMNEKMWTDLFMRNKNYLLDEIDILIKNLNDYKIALENNDSEQVSKLISEGRKLKEENLIRRKGQPD